MTANLAVLEAALQPHHWQHANTQLVSKLLSEFLYEDLLTTTLLDQQGHRHYHQLDLGAEVYYLFTAEQRIFGNWHIDTGSLIRYQQQQATRAVSVAQFLHDSYARIGIDQLTLGHLLRELNHTLLADCHILANNQQTNAHLLTLTNPELESHLTGHPWFVVSKGRLGFSYADYQQYAPEMQQPIQLSWIAIHRKRAQFNAITTLDYNQLLHSELSPHDQARFTQQLNERNLAAADYYFMPIHDWQWQQHLIYHFSALIADRAIVYLGPSSDRYQPTQSVRTFCNLSSSTKLQVKLPLSIFNTAVYRGLPGRRTQLAPMLTGWLQQTYHADTFLRQQCRLIMLGEIASIHVPHPDYEPLPGVAYQYKELSGVIWRENMQTYLHSNEQAITMAALLHLDSEQQPFIAALISQSGLTTNAWLQQLFQATLPPLLHWLYHYGVAFSPHGENTLLILENHRPVGLILKDFIDDVNITRHDFVELQTMPAAVKETLIKMDDTMITQFIHSGLFVVLYRYLSDILHTHLQFCEADFWQLVHDTIHRYQQQQPTLQARFAQFDLLRETFPKLCLNRIRLLTVGYADYADRPEPAWSANMNNPANQQYIEHWRRSTAEGYR